MIHRRLGRGNLSGRSSFREFLFLFLPASQIPSMAASCTLFELNEFIRRVLSLNLQESLWVRCELSGVKVSRGHYYLELVQKAEGGDNIVAQGQAVIWNGAYRTLQRKPGMELDALLQEGMEVLMLAKVDFHERYGLKLIVEDFDPAYTIGKLELKRREILRQLQALNLLVRQKRLELPLVLQNLAVITSETAAGYRDFDEHLKHNPLNYKFKLSIFQAAMQGDRVEPEMLAQFENIRRQADEFDALVIIRGGGAKLDLAAFDSLELGKAIAHFPIPILTGIGHEIDETVLDLVAYSALKTPTAVADFILNHNMQFEAGLMGLSQTIAKLMDETISAEKSRLQQMSQTIFFQSKNLINNELTRLDFLEKEIPATSSRIFSTQNFQLDAAETAIELLDPVKVFRRGFSIALKEGKPVRSTEEVQSGDELEIRLYEGSILTSVKEIKNE